MATVPSFPPNLRALVVDDEPSVRLALDCAMQDEGWEVRVADSGEEALAVMAEWKPDVILSDKNMPDMTGVDLLREVRRKSSTVAFVLMTGYGSLDSLQEATHLDVDGYLQKPFRNIFAMLTSVRGYVARRVSRNRFREAREHFQRAAGVDKVALASRPCPAVAVLLPDGPAKERVMWALEPLFSSKTACLAEAGRDEHVLVAVCATDRLSDAMGSYPHAFAVVMASSGDLSSLLELVDLGANLVIDPSESAEAIRLSIERAVRLAAPTPEPRGAAR